MDIDPVKYEVFLHRLWAIGEEGRQTLQRVTASPIVAQGGEVMSSFYDIEGKMVLACSGHLRFAGATSDAIKYLIEWYGKSPGFFDGDQIFFNDPYVAGSHTYDMMVVKPIFHRGEMIAWTATSTHTADTGGLAPGRRLRDLSRGHPHPRRQGGGEGRVPRGHLQDPHRAVPGPAVRGPGREGHDRRQQRVRQALSGAGGEVRPGVPGRRRSEDHRRLGGDGPRQAPLPARRPVGVAPLQHGPQQADQHGHAHPDRVHRHQGRGTP